MEKLTQRFMALIIVYRHLEGQVDALLQGLTLPVSVRRLLGGRLGTGIHGFIPLLSVHNHMEGHLETLVQIFI